MMFPFFSHPIYCEAIASMYFVRARVSMFVPGIFKHKKNQRDERQQKRVTMQKNYYQLLI